MPSRPYIEYSLRTCCTEQDTLKLSAMNSLLRSSRSIRAIGTSPTTSRFPTLLQSRLNSHSTYGDGETKPEEDRNKPTRDMEHPGTYRLFHCHDCRGNKLTTTTHQAHHPPTSAAKTARNRSPRTSSPTSQTPRLVRSRRISRRGRRTMLSRQSRTLASRRMLTTRGTRSLMCLMK